MLITGKYRNSFIQRLGEAGAILAGLKEGRRVWIHAVSVGEATAAAPIVASMKKRRPDVQVVFSTSTETGQDMAKRLVKEADVFIYFPLIFRLLFVRHWILFIRMSLPWWKQSCGRISCCLQQARHLIFDGERKDFPPFLWQISGDRIFLAKNS